MEHPTCPTCGSRNLYVSAPISAGGGHAPNYLPGLGGMLTAGKFELVLCADCGHTRFFATDAAREKIAGSKRWRRL